MEIDNIEVSNTVRINFAPDDHAVGTVREVDKKHSEVRIIWAKFPGEKSEDWFQVEDLESLEG